MPVESLKHPFQSNVSSWELHRVTVTEEIDKSQQMSNISAFLKQRDRLPGILAGVYHNTQVYTITGRLQKRPSFILGGKKQCTIILHSSIKKPPLISLNIKRLYFFRILLRVFSLLLSTTGSLRSIIPNRCSPSHHPHPTPFLHFFQGNLPSWES